MNAEYLKIRLKIFHHYSIADAIYAHLGMGGDDEFIMDCYNHECNAARIMEERLQRVLSMREYEKIMNFSIFKLLEMERTGEL